MQPGDILVYTRRPFALKHLASWAAGVATQLVMRRPYVHVEIYDGDGWSWAGRGCERAGRLPLREEQLAMVIRAPRPLDIERGRAFGRTLIGHQFGMRDISGFLGWPFRYSDKHICSSIVVEYMRHAGWDLFPGVNSRTIAPSHIADAYSHLQVPR